MTQFLLVAAVALTVGAIVFGVAALMTGDDGGLEPVEPDGRAVPLPADRPLAEPDLARVRFDTALRGYRMAQVDAAIRRTAYDIGFKDELIRVLQAEVDALREGRLPDAEVLRRAREVSLAPGGPDPAVVGAPEPGGPDPAVVGAPEPAGSDPAAPGPQASEPGTHPAWTEPEDGDPTDPRPGGAGDAPAPESR